MKTYANKLYSISDAAKRADITEDQILTMITDKFILPAPGYIRPPFIKGIDIPGLKKIWEKYQKVAKAKKAELRKKPIKVTMLRMDKGD